ncbi:MAG: adenine phosphoribosyltransferase [Acidimicrobiales bacterium]
MVGRTARRGGRHRVAGFLLGTPVARQLGAGFVPVRKPGKLPFRTHRVDYGLEYGSDTLEIHVDGLEVGQRVVVIDDVLATGGTAAATAELVGRTGASVTGFGFLLELSFLGGRGALDGSPVAAVLRVEGDT